jgi:hypothetical protein
MPGYQIIHERSFDVALNALFGIEDGDRRIFCVTWVLSRNPRCEDECVQLGDVWMIKMLTPDKPFAEVSIFYVVDDRKKVVHLLMITK